MPNEKELVTSSLIDCVGRAFQMFLERNGYDIIETKFEAADVTWDFIVSEGTTLVFILTNISGARGDDLVEPDFSNRLKFERSIIAYLDTHTQAIDMRVRIDTLSGTVIGQNLDSMFIKHHLNVLGK